MKMIKTGIPKTTSSTTEFTKPGLGQSMIPMNTPKWQEGHQNNV